MANAKQMLVIKKTKTKTKPWFEDSKSSNCFYFYFKIASYRFLIQISYWTSELHKQNTDNFMVFSLKFLLLKSKKLQKDGLSILNL